MLTADKVTELFCMADDFCKFFDKMTEKYTLKSENKRPYHRDSTMSKAEIMLIMILFHDSGYRCLKHFYLEKVCKHLRGLFPKAPYLHDALFFTLLYIQTNQNLHIRLRLHPGQTSQASRL